GRVGRGRANHRAGRSRRGAARSPARRHAAAARRRLGQRSHAAHRSQSRDRPAAAEPRRAARRDACRRPGRGRGGGLDRRGPARAGPAHQRPGPATLARRELQEALAKLDPEATRRALERLAEAQQQLRTELERSQELFRRAAVEGTLATLAADAEDLRRRQAEWNRDAAPQPDSAAATRQRTLAGAADSLAGAIGRGAKELGAPPRETAPP